MIKQLFSTSWTVWVAIAAYALCSSSMLFLNKLAVSYMPGNEIRLLPGPISCIQLLFSLLFCIGLWVFGMATYKGITSKVFQMYTIYSFLFVGSVYSSMQALKGSNVETQIVFRSATPLVVSVLDFFFLGRELPSRKSTISLLGILAGAIAYVLTDSEFKLIGFRAYSWISLYFVLICMEMTIGKLMMSNYRINSIWGSVLLTNGTAFPQMVLLSYCQGEFENFEEALVLALSKQWSVILGTCIVGTLIGWTGWNCRSVVSATSYTLVGVINKIFTVILSVMFLEKHASGEGITALLLCIAASTFYEQAPLRSCRYSTKFDRESTISLTPAKSSSSCNL
mmetsp:Transcript_20459/g.46435  ORF Transcript_20459/g.46435 Transcript_20459/m.46435 type:complete len:339 (+) Transcript_20459:77-1093(+)